MGPRGTHASSAATIAAAADRFLIPCNDHGSGSIDAMGTSRIPPAAASAFIDSSRIDAILAPIVPDDEDRAFVVRCILGEGPVHHRGANYVLLTLLGALVEAAGEVDIEALRARGTVPVAMRVPPHLARPGSMMSYPLSLPTAPLERLAAAGSVEQAAMADCLTDGPPQHALANAAMVWLVGAALEKLDRPSAKSRARPSTRAKR